VESLADSYMQFLYFGLVVLFLLGLRICRFMRVRLRGCRSAAIALLGRASLAHVLGQPRADAHRPELPGRLPSQPTNPPTPAPLTRHPHRRCTWA
jgi:hypothetical protein